MNDNIIIYIIVKVNDVVRYPKGSDWSCRVIMEQCTFTHYSRDAQHCVKSHSIENARIKFTKSTYLLKNKKTNLSS